MTKAADKAASNFLKLGLDSIQQGFCIFDSEHRLVECNKRFLELMDYPADLAKPGVRIRDFARYNAERGEYGRGDIEVLAREHLEYLAKPGHAQFDRTRPNGTIIDVRVIHLPDGGVVVAYADVTELRRAERELRSKAEIIDQIHEAVVINDIEGIITEWNKSAERITQYTAAEAIGRHYSFGIDDSETLVSEPEMLKIIEATGNFERELKARRKSGEQYYIHFSVSVLRGGDGAPTGFVSVVTDITDRKQAEEALKHSETALRESEQLLRLVSDNMPALIAYVDAERRFRFVNETCAKWYNMPRDRIMGMQVGEILGHRLKVHSGRWERLLQGEKQKFEDNIAYEDGVERDVEVNLIPHFDDKGEVMGGFIMSLDLTARKAAERQLRQSQRMEAVGQLTGGLAHDFNNLLMVMLGNIEFAATKLDSSDEIVALLEKALGAGRRGAELTQRLLAFARQQPLRAEVVSVNDLVNGMTDLFKRSLGETVKIRTELTANVWPAMVDRGLLENALLNVVLNARDAMPEGGLITIQSGNATITEEMAAAQSEFEAGDFVRLVVRDTGAGMTSETRAQAFEPFFTTKDVGQGSGLGLSMAYGFAKQSGGFVAIESEVGKGSAVELYLPRAQLDQIVPEPSHESPLNHEDGGKTILVVEDEADVREMTVAMLRSLGYETLEAPDARRATEILAQSPNIALVLSDIVLGGGRSGVDLAREIRDSGRDLKILLMTGYPRDDVISETFQDRDVGLILKPFMKAQLARKLRQILDSGD